MLWMQTQVTLWSMSPIQQYYSTEEKTDVETALCKCQDGNGVVRAKYLSVFLELCAGLPETSKLVCSLIYI